MSFQSEVKSDMRVDVYQFTSYDISTDKVITSKRWGTLAGIEGAGGTAILSTKTLIDASALGSEVNGLTAIGYMPVQ